MDSLHLCQLEPKSESTYAVMLAHMQRCTATSDQYNLLVAVVGEEEEEV